MANHGWRYHYIRWRLCPSKRSGEVQRQRYLLALTITVCILTPLFTYSPCATPTYRTHMRSVDRPSARHSLPLLITISCKQNKINKQTVFHEELNDYTICP